MRSFDNQPQSRPQNAGFLGRANEGDFCFRAAGPSVKRGETGTPSSGKGLAAFCWPRSHQARHSITRVSDAPEMIGVVDHQLYWLVPQITAHFVASNVFPAEEIRSRRTRSVDFEDRTKVGGACATKGPGARSVNSCALVEAERGRRCGPSTYANSSGRNTPAAGRGLDHPRLDCRLLHQDSLFIPKRANGVASYLERFVSVVCHVAGLKSCLMGKVPVALWPIFEKINGICQRDYLPNKAFPLLQIYGAIKVRVHSYLTENVGDQQGWRRRAAPAENLFFRLSRFNTYRVNFFRRTLP